MKTLADLNAELNELEAKKILLEEDLKDAQNDVDNFEYQATDEEYENFLDEMYGTVEVAGYTYSTSLILQNIDPTAFRCGKSDYEADYDLDDSEEYTDLCDIVTGKRDEIEDLETEINDLKDEILDTEMAEEEY